MEKKFWHSVSQWPADPAGYVFLARAVQLVGSSMFGKEWTGQEATTEYKRMEPQRSVRISPNLNRASRYSSLSISPKTPVPGVEASEAERETARIIAQHNEASRPALTRLAVAQREIVKRCESGELVSAARPTKGGAMTSLPQTHWNTEQWGNRFVMCQINPRKPFDMGYAGDAYCWIFLETQSLHRLLLSLPHAQSGSADHIHYSPYLRLMLAVVKKLEIAPDCQPKKEVVMAELEKNWPHSIPWSENLLKAMATLVREPESQAGRTSKRGNAGRKR